MKIDSIVNGIVIDHIGAGRAMLLYKLLKLDKLQDHSVAMIMNVQSQKMGRKDIIKVDADIDLDLDVIAYVDPHATVNIIRNEELVEKKAIQLPERLVNVVKCKNPRCITSVEQDLPHIFKLTDAKKATYRCLYCETKAERP